MLGERRGFIVGGLTLALLIAVSLTAPAASDSRRAVSGPTSAAALPYFGLLPSLAYDASRRQVVLFNNRGETWLWAQDRWRQAHPTVSPSGRIGAVAAWDPLMGAVLLVGGQSYADETVLHDTWAWNGSNWREFGTRTASPLEAFAFAMTYDSDLEQMVLVGSDFRLGTPVRLWTWDGAAWHEHRSAGGPVSPVPVVAYDPLTETVLAVSARCSRAVCQPETWSWNGASWEQLEPAHQPGFAFSSMTMVADPISRRLVLLTVAPTTVGPAPTETWTWDGHDWNLQGMLGRQESLAVAATADGVNGVILAFQDVARDFKTLRIDAWGWMGDSWRAINAGMNASGL